MLAREYYEFKNRLHEQGIMFSFTGYVSEAILFSLGDALKKKMALEDTDANVIKRVFSVFVEQVQNIIRYSAERLDAGEAERARLSSGMITVGAKGQRFFVVCGNVLSNRQVPQLRERLEHLKGLDKAAIKAYYKQKLKEPPEADSQGATIGLVEIARRASEPVEFDFLDLGDDTAFFCLKAYI